MLKKFFFLSSVILLLFSCEAKVPEDVIERGTMENLLYDYHLAQSLAKNGGDSADYRTKLYTSAVFNKYGVDEERFNHSMEWYTRNSEELFAIYKKLDKRFAAANSLHIVKGNPYASMTEEGDTMNIWSGKDFYLLTNYVNNRIEFEQKVDSGLEFGDRLMWQFESKWFSHEGSKNAIVMLALVYENDSVDSRKQSLYASGKQEIFIVAGDKKVKSILGFIYQSTPWKELPQILTISDPVLVKFKDLRPTSKDLEKSSIKAADDHSEKADAIKPVISDTTRSVSRVRYSDKSMLLESTGENEPPARPTRMLPLPR